MRELPLPRLSSQVLPLLNSHGTGNGAHRGAARKGVSGRPFGARSDLLRWSCRYGVGSAYEPPKMSVLPNMAGQSCWGAGRDGSDGSPAAVPSTISCR